MSDDVGQRVSSEAGGQEREALQEIRGVIERAIARWEAGEDFPVHLVLKAAQELLAALDAANSRAEEAERKKTGAERRALEIARRSDANYREWKKAEARIRELEEENLALRVALRDERLSRRSALRRALRWKLALSQATKREGEE